MINTIKIEEKIPYSKHIAVVLGNNKKYEISYTLEEQIVN